MSDDAQQATGLRVYLTVEDDAQIEKTMDALADCLLEQGYNAGPESVTAVIAAVSEHADALDVEAWAEGVEAFVAAMGGFAASLLIPGSNKWPQGDDDE